MLSLCRADQGTVPTMHSASPHAAANNNLPPSDAPVSPPTGEPAIIYHWRPALLLRIAALMCSVITFGKKLDSARGVCLPGDETLATPMVAVRRPTESAVPACSGCSPLCLVASRQEDRSISADTAAPPRSQQPVRGEIIELTCEATAGSKPVVKATVSCCEEQSAAELRVCLKLKSLSGYVGGRSSAAVFVESVKFEVSICCCC